MKTEFSTLDIVKALGIPRERLRDWMGRSFVVPSSSAHGQGTKAVFTRHDVYGIALFRCLLDIGFNRAKAGSLVKQFMKREKEHPGEQETAYIKFMVDREGKVSLTQTLPEGDWKYDYETGLTTKGNEDAKMLAQEAENEYIADQKWGIVQIIYVEHLRREVELGLSKL
jgi:hypothetical protein